MPGLRRHADGIGLTPDEINETERLLDRHGLHINPSVRHDADKAREDKLRVPEGGIRSQGRFQPDTVFRMSLGILPIGVDEDIHVGQDHNNPSMRSRRSALLLMSTPGSNPPLPP